MNDQAKKLRELAQRIRDERQQADLDIDPIIDNSGSKESPNLLRSSSKEVSQQPAEMPEFPIPGRDRTQIKRNLSSSARRAATVRDINLTPPPPLKQNEFNTRVIAVSSGKGGVGKSNVVANLGIALAMRGRKVVLLDADLGLANIDVIFGINPRYNLKHLLDGEKTLQEIIVIGPHALKIVPGGSGVPELANLSDEQQQAMMTDFAALEREADITLIDTGAGISKDIISFILAAREALIITTPEPTAITDAYGLIKVLTQRDLDVDIQIVVNMVTSEKEGREISDRIVMATKQFLNKKIEPAGYILADPAVNLSVRQQTPFILGYPNSKASKCISELATRLDITSYEDLQIAGRNGFRGFLSRLFER